MASLAARNLDLRLHKNPFVCFNNLFLRLFAWTPLFTRDKELNVECRMWFSDSILNVLIPNYVLLSTYYALIIRALTFLLNSLGTAILPCLRWPFEPLSLALKWFWPGGRFKTLPDPVILILFSSDLLVLLLMVL